MSVMERKQRNRSIWNYWMNQPPNENKEADLDVPQGFERTDGR
jgi:hypothetical protein